MTNRVSRSLAVGAVALGLVSTAILGSADAAAEAAGKRPLLALEAVKKSVTLESYQGTVFLDLGVFAVAGDRPFEIRAYRSGYAHPITALRSQPGPDAVLPAGLVQDFTGLARFASVTVEDGRGRRVLRTSTTFCPNGYETVRRRPDAPATSPYPNGCAGNPYSTGAVWGIQKGYGTSALGFTEATLSPGKYAASVSITPAYRKALHIPAAAAHARVAVTVVEGRGDDPVFRGQQPAAGPEASDAAPTAPTGRAAAPSGPLPDLRSLPAWGIAVERGRYLDFAATVWNAGTSPLVVDGFRRSEEVMDAYQYFFDARGHQVGYAPVGTMEWDERDGHNHWHFTDFATYRLVDRKKKVVLRSQKEAFCLANTDAVDYTVPGSNWRPENTDLHTSCGQESSLGVREVLDVGSGDTYQQYLPGQSFDLKGLKNGSYYIEVKANPGKRLHETSLTNNTSYRKVTISGRSGHRKVAVQKVGIVVEPAPEIEDPDAR